MTNVTSFVCIRTYVLNVTITFFLKLLLASIMHYITNIIDYLALAVYQCRKKCMLNDMLTLPTFHAFSTACTASV